MVVPSPVHMELKLKLISLPPIHKSTPIPNWIRNVRRQKLYIK